MGVGTKKIQALVDVLRQNLLYQVPQPIFVDNESDEPDHILVKIKPNSYRIIRQLIEEHGGWDLSPEQRSQAMQSHDAVAQEAFNGADLTELSMGDLVQMATDCQGVEELSKLGGRIAEELTARRIRQ
jgi:hypothetical protein